MIAPTVTYDGTVLNNTFTIIDASRPLMADPKPNLATIPGGNGSAFRGTRLDVQKVTLKLGVIGDDYEDVLASQRTLAALLNVKQPKKLVFSDEGGWYRYAVVSSVAKVSRIGTEAAIFDITFTIPNGCLEKDGYTVNFSSNATMSVTVGGTLPATVTFSGTASAATATVTDSTTGNLMRFTDANSKAIAFDTAKRTATVGGTVALPTLASTWLLLEPGTHSIKLTNFTLPATLTIYERTV